MSKKYTAQCACGLCKFAFDADPSFIANCYCKDCQKASGGAMATFAGVAESDFTLTSGTPTAFHYTAESGNGLDRHFCPTCGTRLFTSHLESFPGMVFVAVGSLDRPELLSPKIEMFTKRRLHWTRPLDVPQFESMPTG